MSILDYIFTNDGITIFSDSISSSPDGRPVNYVTKIFPLPHINAVLCGTGLQFLVLDWFSYILKSLIINNVETLNMFTSTSLISIFESYKLNTDCSTTIYQFGYLEDSDSYKGFAYRSGKNFVSEELSYCIAVKPHQGIDMKNLDSNIMHMTISDFIEICKKQKLYDDHLISEDKVGIGGSIYMYSMKKKFFSMEEIYTYDDKESKYAEMLQTIEDIGGKLKK